MRIYQIFLLGVSLAMAAGCSKYYLAVDQQWIDVRYLASTFAKSPDPRQAKPPLGQMLVFEWYLPKEVIREEPMLQVDVILWDYSTRHLDIPIKRRMSTTTFKLLNEEYDKSGGILTYKAQIVTKSGEVFREWKHQLWVKLITLDEEPEKAAVVPSESTP